MEYGVPPGFLYSSPPPMYSNAYAGNTEMMYDPSSWIQALNSLRGQKGYLEFLLSKTATTLNALRDRQTRNELALSTNPAPRTRKKKILQNRYRTNKTIQTCENEERVILDCLHACTCNIKTLEAIISTTDVSCITAEYNASTSYPDSETTGYGWNGWTDDTPISPFQKGRRLPLPRDEIAPDISLDRVSTSNMDQIVTKRLPPLSERPCSLSHASMLLAPPNTARTQSSYSSLSPEAAVFKPRVAYIPRVDDEIPKALDKLTISGLLASKRMHMIQKRRFSDQTIGNLVRRLSGHARPHLSRHRSWTVTDAEETQEENEGKAQATTKRVCSV